MATIAIVGCGLVGTSWSLVFGLSASHSFFSVFPESWVFSALALLP